MAKFALEMKIVISARTEDLAFKKAKAMCRGGASILSFYEISKVCPGGDNHNEYCGHSSGSGPMWGS